jgi:hypothetical protein
MKCAIDFKALSNFAPIQFVRRRATHEVPKELDPPPKEWEPEFNELAAECRLEMKMDAGYQVVRAFRKVLEGGQ